jgi:hypothetical protein
MITAIELHYPTAKNNHFSFPIVGDLLYVGKIIGIKKIKKHNNTRK